MRGWQDTPPTALLVLADGTVIGGEGIGATGKAVGEVCFNTAMTGYEEILTDPSYAGQIITFTFPHIGNVGVNDEDIETVNMAAASGGTRLLVDTSCKLMMRLGCKSPRYCPTMPPIDRPRKCARSILRWSIRPMVSAVSVSKL